MGRLAANGKGRALGVNRKIASTANKGGDTAMERKDKDGETPDGSHSSPVGHPGQNQPGHLGQNKHDQHFKQDHTFELPQFRLLRQTAERVCVCVWRAQAVCVWLREELQVEPTWQTEVILTLIMLVINWKEANRVRSFQNHIVTNTHSPSPGPGCAGSTRDTSRTLPHCSLQRTKE